MYTKDMNFKSFLKLLKRLNIKRGVERTNKSAPLSIIVLFATILGALITFHTATAILTDWYNSSVGWKQVEQAKIDKLSPLESMDYISSVLGIPELKMPGHNGLKKYIFKEKGYWVTAYANDSNSVEHLLFTSCNEGGFYPKVSKNPVGPPVIIGKTTFDEVLYENASTNGRSYNPHYFLRGATAPSYFIDETSLGNPSSYQTVYSGIVEYCGIPNFPIDAQEQLEGGHVTKTGTNAPGLSQENIDKMRSRAAINTFGVSAPHAKSLYESPAVTDLTISYVNAGVLERCSMSRERYEKVLDDILKRKDKISPLKPTEEYRTVKVDWDKC